MSDITTLPAPRYQIGARVWLASTSTEVRSLPCPDCLGSRRWAVTTPGGETFEVKCQRCDGYDGHTRGVPSLTYRETAATVRALTTGSIQIDTGRHDYWDAVRYMCIETGVGSGSVYNESDLFGTEEEARKAAQIKAALANEPAAATPERTKQALYSTLTLKDAALKAADDAVWASWLAYRYLREDVEGHLDEGLGGTLDDLRSELRHTLEFKANYREPHPLRALLDAASTVVAESTPDSAPSNAAVERLAAAVDHIRAEPARPPAKAA